MWTIQVSSRGGIDVAHMVSKAAGVSCRCSSSWGHSNPEAAEPYVLTVRQGLQPKRLFGSLLQGLQAFSGLRFWVGFFGVFLVF